MSKYYKPKDTAPYICRAGVKNKYEEDVASCMKNYPLEDIVVALKHGAKIPEKEPLPKYKRPALSNTRNIGVFTEMKEILGQPVQTRFQTLMNDLKETSYQSYWTEQVGRAKDYTGRFPLDIDRYETVFGNPSRNDGTVKEVVSPDKNFGQVSDEYIKGHELYRKSHNDYYPNERIDRKYLQPAFNPNQTFGHKYNSDLRGSVLKCRLNIGYETYTTGSKVLADFQQERVPKLGLPFAPNNNISCVPEGHAFGIPTKTMFTVADCFAENPKPDQKKDIEYYLTFLNPLRAYLKHRFNKNLFFFDEFLDALRYYDKDNTGWIPIKIAYDICNCFKLFYTREPIEKFLRLINVVKDDQIYYERFVDALNWQVTYPDIGECYHIPIDPSNYVSTYQAALHDHKFIDNSHDRPAGIPSCRLDVSHPVVPLGCCRADLVNLCSETEAATLLYPSVYTKYGLTFFDLLQPREKQKIREIFTGVGFVLDDDTFEKLWKEGCELDKCDMVCVTTFKNLIKSHNVKYNPNQSN